MTAPDNRCIVHLGDSRVVLKSLASNSVDAIVTDPPYGLSAAPDVHAMLRAWLAGEEYRHGSKGGFMGKAWDAFVPGPAVWIECLRVLKPGGHLVAFFGTRTYDLGALAIRLAGFEIRDMLAWLYGSGFPKSHDVSKAIDKAAGAVREVIATGAPVKRMIPGADQHEGGWEKADGREYVPTETAAATDDARQWDGWGTALKPALEPVVLARKPLISTVAANVLEHGTGAINIDACRVEGNPRAWGSQTPAAGWGMGGHINPPSEAGRWPANVIHDGSDEVVNAFPAERPAGGNIRSSAPSDKTDSIFGAFSGRFDNTTYGDSGSAARFFYSAKADADDRLGSAHATVKPGELMAWLVRLVTPGGGVVLDPFAGTGSTGLAALREGRRAILIELDPVHVADIELRLAHARGAAGHTASLKVRNKPVKSLGPLFGEGAA